jgi:cytochrome c
VKPAAGNCRGLFAFLRPHATAAAIENRRGFAAKHPFEEMIMRANNDAGASAFMALAGAASILAACFAVYASAAFAADEIDGEATFNNACRTCHSSRPGDDRLGPNLHGIVGRKAGAAEGFKNYSPSLKNSGLTWDEATIDKFIANPDAVVQGNNMKPYTGLSDAAQRAAIIAFLKTRT